MCVCFFSSSFKLKAHNSRRQFESFQSGLKFFMKFSFQRKPIYRILNDLIAAHVVVGWAGGCCVGTVKRNGGTKLHHCRHSRGSAGEKTASGARVVGRAGDYGGNKESRLCLIWRRSPPPRVRREHQQIQRRVGSGRLEKSSPGSLSQIGELI